MEELPPLEAGDAPTTNGSSASSEFLSGQDFPEQLEGTETLLAGQPAPALGTVFVEKTASEEASTQAQQESAPAHFVEQASEKTEKEEEESGGGGGGEEEEVEAQSLVNGAGDGEQGTEEGSSLIAATDPSEGNAPVAEEAQGVQPATEGGVPAALDSSEGNGASTADANTNGLLSPVEGAEAAAATEEAVTEEVAAAAAVVAAAPVVGNGPSEMEVEEGGEAGALPKAEGDQEMDVEKENGEHAAPEKDGGGVSSGMDGQQQPPEAGTNDTAEMPAASPAAPETQAEAEAGQQGTEAVSADGKGAGPYVTDDERNEILKRAQAAFESAASLAPGDVALYGAAVPTVWDDEEMVILDEGLKQYPAEAVSNMTLYLKLASLLPKKCVREVAAKIKAIQDGHRVTYNAVVNRQQHAMYAASGGDGSGRGQGMGSPMMFSPGGGTPQGGMQPFSTGQAHLNDRAMENNVNQILTDNMATIAHIRNNILSGRMGDNYGLMHRFTENVGEVLEMLNTLPLRMPPLPVQINTYLLTQGGAGGPGGGGDGSHMRGMGGKPSPPRNGDSSAAVSVMGGPVAATGHPPSPSPYPQQASGGGKRSSSGSGYRV